MKNENEIMQLMNNIEYGWVDKYNDRHKAVDNTYSDNYKLQSPEELIKNNIGVCWDQVELERFLFKNTHFIIKTYFIVHYDNNRCPSHTFLTFENNNKIYWFEHSWHKHKGIHEYRNTNELLLDVRSKFIFSELKNSYNENSLCIYEYSVPKFGISVIEFYKHCESGININIFN